MAETQSKKVTPEAEPTATPEAAGETTGTTETTETTEEKKSTSSRVDFPIKDATYRNEKGEIVSAVNGDSLLIAVPKPIKEEKDGKTTVIYAGFNTRKHNPLKKGDFADEVTFIRHGAFVSRVKAAILLKAAEDKELKANQMAQYGDEETRKKVQKMARMKEQLATLTSQLQADGVDTSQI